MLHALVLTALGLEERVFDIFNFFSSDGEGNRFPIVKEYGFKNIPETHYQLADRYKKISSTNCLRIISSDDDFGTKSHVIASIIHSSFRESYTKILNQLNRFGFGGALHNVYGPDKMPNHYDTDTNSLVSIAFGIEGEFKNAQRILSDFGKTGDVFCDSLLYIAQIINNCESQQSIDHFIEMVESQNQKGSPPNIRWFDSMEEYEKETAIYGEITKSIEAAAGYALLLNNTGQKELALERLKTLDHYGKTPIKAQMNNLSISEPLLYLALAYADISRASSVFTSKVIDVDFSSAIIREDH